MARTRKKTKMVIQGELQATIKDIEKEFGINTIMAASDVDQPDRISTGVFILDLALLGGIPFNRCSMVVGERHAGKSTIANLVAASAQVMYPDQIPVIVDVEGTFDAVWAGKLGVNLDNLLIAKCESGEMAIDVTDAVVGSRETSLVIIDSIAAVVPMKELDTSAEDQFIGLQARLMGNLIRKVTNGLVRERKRNHNVTILFINQFRSKIGGWIGHGDPRSIPGGRAVEFCTSVQFEIKNKENKNNDSRGIEAVTTNEHSFIIKKNKLNNGPRSGEFVLIRQDDEKTGLREGQVDDGITLLAYAKKMGFYTGGGASWKLVIDDEEHRVKNVEQAIALLYEDRDKYWSLRCQLIRAQAEEMGMPKKFIDNIV